MGKTEVNAMRAAAYARYSTDKQTRNSIEYQLTEIGKYCKEHEITVVATYTDEAETGTNMDRPGFQAMVKAAGRGEFEAVVVYDITRGSRDVGDWFSFRKAMLMLGVQVIAATQNLGDITNSNDFLVELLSVGMGQRKSWKTVKSPLRALP
ncbi:recombinase family protein [Oscillibacter sp. MSJ-2]|uniref:Recombinase family protein n=1 Tax=Dysosmobacter acutus TaxID=2841504 RepID=A0ABS6F6A2_9FIRM|nr:recombinase family protein [Dysosmobacter acutus]MBU5625692.1 recombinase family protein [Dysosmobacter acutus]